MIPAFSGRKKGITYPGEVKRKPPPKPSTAGLGKGGRQDAESRYRAQMASYKRGGGDPYLTTEVVERAKGPRIFASAGKGSDPIPRGGVRRTVADVSGFKLDPERAKDARNWEYWYKREHGNKAVGGTYTRMVGGKGGEEKTFSNQARAINRAQQEADKQGQEVWEIEQIQAETAALEALNARRRRAAIEGQRFSSLRAAEALGAAKQSAARRAAALGEGAGGEGSGLFGTKTAQELRARKVV